MPNPMVKPMSATAVVPASTQTYTQAQAALTQIAERLRAASPTAIDTILADVREARRLHAILKDRLAAIRAELDAEVAAAEADATT